MTAAAEPVWIDNETDLERAVAHLSGARSLAIDTEADSFYHYFHKCCLIQISDGHTDYLIDPIALRQPRALAPILSATVPGKVLHAAEQDVLYLRRDFGFDLQPLFDTMVAAQLLGRKNIGLAGLLKESFGLTLDKVCQRDDWSRRPLTPRQMSYAAEDVRHLIRLHHALETELEARGRLAWAREEFEHIARRAWTPREFDREDFWGLKGARDLEPESAAVLRELYALRDERARSADVPPFRVLADETLIALARRRPRAPSDLDGIKGFTPLVRRRIGPLVLAAAARGLELRETERPTPPKGQGKRRSAAFRTRVERLREWRRNRAAELGLDPGVLFPQTTLEGLAERGYPGLEQNDVIPGLRHWRREILLPEAARLLA